MKYLITALISFFVITSTFSQVVNIEKFRLDKDTTNAFFSNVELGFLMVKQNVRVNTFNGSGKAVYLSDNHGFMLIGNENLQGVNYRNVLSRGYLHYRMNFWRRKIISFEQFNQIQYDIGRDLRKRWLIGASPRLKLISSENVDLSINSGLMYESELWQNDAVMIWNESIKSTTHFTLKIKLHENISLFSITYYQAKLTSLLKPRLITDSAIQFKITDRFSLKTSYMATFDRAPILEVARYIYNFENSLVYSF